MNIKYILPVVLFFGFSNNLLSQEVIDKEISPLQQLITEIEEGIDIEKRFDFSRANTKEKKLNELKRINKKLEKDLADAEALSVKLTNQFDENEKKLAELEEKLTLKLGNLGEMFGVVKQVSGQTRGEFKNFSSNKSI
jgi:biopolymer transport protein ExbB